MFGLILNKLFIFQWVDGKLSFRFNFKFSFVAYHYKILVVDGLCPVKPGWNEGKDLRVQAHRKTWRIAGF